MGIKGVSLINPVGERVVSSSEGGISGGFCEGKRKSDVSSLLGGGGTRAECLGAFVIGRRGDAARGSGGGGGAGDLGGRGRGGGSGGGVRSRLEVGVGLGDDHGELGGLGRHGLDQREEGLKEGDEEEEKEERAGGGGASKRLLPLDGSAALVGEEESGEHCSWRRWCWRLEEETARREKKLLILELRGKRVAFELLLDAVAEKDNNAVYSASHHTRLQYIQFFRWGLSEHGEGAES